MYKNIPLEEQKEFHSRVIANKKQYSYPETKEQWWSLVDRFWPELFSIVVTYNPPSINGQKTPLYIGALKNNKDAELAEIFSQAWGRAPDDGYIHLIPGWDVLCDLCSESYVLEN